MNEPVFGLRVRGLTQNAILSPSLAKSILSHRGASANLFEHRAAEYVFGDNGLLRKMDPAMHKSIHDALTLLMREPYLSDALSVAVEFIKRETPNLVSFNHSIVDQSIWERPSEVSVVEGSKPPTCEAKLFSLTRNFVGNIITSVFMGSALIDYYPDLLQDLWVIHDQFFNLYSGAPRWIPVPGVSAAYGARHRLQQVMTAFHTAFAVSEDGLDPGIEFRDLGGLSEMMGQRMQSWRKLNYAPRASANGDLPLLWAMNANVTVMVFWSLFHILADQALLSAVRKEVSSFVTASQRSREETGFPFLEPPRLTLDKDGLLTSCPLLKASYLEAIRMHTNALLYRELQTDLVITESVQDAAVSGVAYPRTYKFHKGDIILIPNGAHQIDPHYFPDPDNFDPHRFIKKDVETGRGTTDMHTMQPYGGGASMCKGHIFAEQMVLISIAAILSMWDITPASSQGWKIPGHYPAPVVLLPKHDFKVRLAHRV
jgi:Cytochrome P450